jgi:hypothetical protein
VTEGPPEGQEEAVRRLLAQSGGPDPLPPEVAARLDATLARLVEERARGGSDSDPEGETEILVLTPRPQRWPKLLLAAAAVVVAGFGIGTLVHNGSLSGSSSADSTSGGAGVAAQSAPNSESGQMPPKKAANPTPQMLRVAGPVHLHSTDLSHEVHRLLRRIGVSNTARLPKSADLSGGAKEFQPVRCAPGRVLPHSRWLPATYDGQRAVLVLGPARRSVVEHSVVPAEVRSCDGTLLDSATVRVR